MLSKMHSPFDSFSNKGLPQQHSLANISKISQAAFIKNEETDSQATLQNFHVA